jgi:hypothetical protein
MVNDAHMPYDGPETMAALKALPRQGWRPSHKPTAREPGLPPATKLLWRPADCPAAASPCHAARVDGSDARSRTDGRRSRSRKITELANCAIFWQSLPADADEFFPSRPRLSVNPCPLRTTALHEDMLPLIAKYLRGCFRSEWPTQLMPFVVAAPMLNRNPRPSD